MLFVSLLFVIFLTVDTIVVTPTYNEKDNIKHFIRRILSADNHIHIVIVDDSSPDGTAPIVETLSREDPRVHLIVLTREKRGRADADRAGIMFALEHGFNIVFQMDADLSHSPEDIPCFLEAIQNADIVIGSRLIQGGRILDRGMLRNAVTHLANAYIRWVLELKPKDCTSGFRCYRREVLASLDLEHMLSSGPSILEEILYVCQQKNYTIREIPITFIDRKKGRSKLGILELIRILFLIVRFKYRNDL